MNDLQRNYNSFIKDMEQQMNIKTNLDKLEYLEDAGYFSEEDFKKKYKEYDGELDYSEWLEEYADEIEDELDDALIENNDPLDIQAYKNPNGNKYEIVLTTGGPHIQLDVDSQRNIITYCIYWGGQKLERDCSYLYDTIYNIYSLELYE